MIDLGLPLDLGDGLVLRSVRPADTDALVAFKADTHRMPGAAEPDAYVAAWARDLLERPHPTFRPEWFLVVEETVTGTIVSSLNLIPQTWTYGGIPVPVGRIEMVSTNPEFRRRGLVRRQMDVAHRLSAELGHLAQVIIGIPWYYRQFGYEYAVAYGGRRSVELDHIVALPNDAPEPFRLRPATAADLPFIAAVAAHGASRYEVTCQRDDALWRYELDGRTIPDRLAVVERVTAADGEPQPVGMLVHSPMLVDGGLSIMAYELAAGVSWLDVTPSLLRALRHRAEQIAAETGEQCSRLGFLLGEDHPVYRTHRDLAPPGTPLYAWYVRVPDIPAFFRHVAPVFEERLARSELAGFSGELKLTFFHDGVRLAFNAGRFSAALSWREEQEQEADAMFPPLTFLQVLFGFRALSDLELAFIDCRIPTPRARLLIDTLFPRQPSLIWPVM